MLVLSRCIEQSILIGPSKTVTTVKVVRIGDGRVRLGFIADDGVEIWREELADGKFETEGDEPCQNS